MLNVFQKGIYYCIALLPSLFIGAVPHLREYFSLTEIIIFCLISSVLYIYLSFKWLRWCVTKIPTTNILLSSIEPYDIQNLTVILTYIIPIISLMLTESNELFIGLSLVGFLFILVTLMNTVLPNPFFIFRYHLYKISIRDGVSGFIFLSTRKLTSIKQVKKVYMIFDYFGVDGDV